MSRYTDEADNVAQHMQEALSPVHEDPISPASSLSNQNQNDNEQILLATMQPVNVLELHESSSHALQNKYHHHHHHHHNPRNHYHNSHHQQHLQSSPDDQQRVQDDHNDRGTPESGTGNPGLGVAGHKMIDLIYNDGQKTVMYTHDKEIIYESEADRVQVVEYPPPPPSPSPPPQSNSNRSGMLSGNCVTGRSTASVLHLHNYQQLQLDHDNDLPRGVVTTSGNPMSANTTGPIIVLSELVPVESDVTAEQLTLSASAAVSIRAG